jgi:signal transduction histidine kinase
VNGTRTSIAFRLIAAVLLVELVSAVLVILLALGYERHAHFRSFDVMLRGRADSVLGAVQDAEDVGDNVMLDLADLHVPDEDVYEVWDGRGHLLGRSSNWPGSSGIRTPQTDGISRLDLSGRHYRLLRLHGSRIVDPGEPGGGHLRPVTILYGAPTERVWHAIRGAVEFYAGGSLLLLAVTGPLIAWLLHRGLSPLRELAAEASHVSARAWAFSPPASARETAELAPLTNALESTLQRLERSFTQQRTFVSDAAHELKTAVAVAKSSLQLLGLKDRTSAEYRAGLEQCLADTRRLEELVAKMLTLARVENGPGAIAAAPKSDIAGCARQIATQLQSVASLRGVSVTVSAPESCCISLTAEDATLVVENLLMNALQHSPQGSQVEMRIATRDGIAELAIVDHGEGIDARVRPFVFDRFYRGDESRARSTGGAGLGLAICKGIVEKTGGSIALESNLGEGTTVTVRLAHASAPALVPPNSQ